MSEVEIIEQEQTYKPNTTNTELPTDNINQEHESITVAIRKEDGKVTFKDDYFSYLVRPELETYISDMIKEEFQEIKIYAENQEHYLSNELTSESTLSDLYQIESSYIAEAKIYVKGNPEITKAEYERKMQNIRNKLLDSGHSYIIYLFVVSPEIYDSMGRYSQNDFWRFYAVNKEPDGNQYYYAYNEYIKGKEE